MAGRPLAEVEIDESVVRGLVATLGDAVPDAGSLPLAHEAEGWDCSVWRLGDERALRLPRRQAVADLMIGESRALAEVAPHVEATGVHVPAPLLVGEPTADFPWPWTLVRFHPGTSGLAVPRERRIPWAKPLANALAALHRPAADEHPRNAFRGVPLADRAAAVEERMDRLAGAVARDEHRALVRAWRDGVAATPWAGPPLWIHGDLHPANLIARDSELVAIIDFVDITGGDPAYDLAAAWLVFDREGRRAFMDASAHVDEQTWTRARAWAAAMTAMFLLASDDHPAYAGLARATLIELAQNSA